jgi:hypothetical protein
LVGGFEVLQSHPWHSRTAAAAEAALGHLNKKSEDDEGKEHVGDGLYREVGKIL